VKLLEIINTKLKDDLRFRIILVVCGILLIVLREPALFIYPRLWAEEGTIFYAFARHHSVWEIFTTSHVGYLTLFNSLVSTIQAKLFSVENAACVSTYMGFLVQLTPICIIAFTAHKFWDSAFKKIICVLTIILVTAPELWVNTTNSHFIFGLITFLIMIIYAPDLSIFQKYFFRAMLFIGGLTGPASIFFTPAFLLKAYREKSKEKYIQAGIMLLCACIQALVILYSILYNNKYNRLSVHDLKTTRYHFIIDNFSLLPHTNLFSFQLFSLDFITLFGLLIGVFYVYLLIKNFKNSDYLIPLLSLIPVAVFSTLGSLDMAGGTRYAYIPTCILMIVILSEIFELSLRKMRYAALFVTGSCFLINLLCYKPIINQWAYMPIYPKWKVEVAKWRADTSYLPKTHPALNNDGWPVKL
jgi:hypothetical protein